MSMIVPLLWLYLIGLALHVPVLVIVAWRMMRDPKHESARTTILAAGICAVLWPQTITVVIREMARGGVDR